MGQRQQEAIATAITELMTSGESGEMLCCTLEAQNATGEVVAIQVMQDSVNITPYPMTTIRWIVSISVAQPRESTISASNSSTGRRESSRRSASTTSRSPMSPGWSTRSSRGCWTATTQPTFPPQRL